MSKVSVAKKLGSISKDDKKSKRTNEKKTEFNVKATHPRVCKIKNFVTENRDERLEMFHRKEMKKSSLPSLSTLLSTSTKDSGISSLLNHSIEKPQQHKIQKYTQNEDIFISKIAKSTFNTNQQFDEGTSSSLDKNRRKSHDYSISDMFSDDLSQKDNLGQEFIYVSSPDNSQADLSLPAINVDEKKVGDLLPKKQKHRMQSKIQKNLGKNGPGLRPETFNPESNFLPKTLERSKEHNETLNSCEIANSIESNKDLRISSRKAERKNSSATFVPKGKMDSGITSLLHNSIENYDNNGEPCFFCNKENQTSSPGHGIRDKTKDRSMPAEIIADVDDSEKSQSCTINIILSDCNLDHAVNSEDFIDGSIKMINKKAIQYMDEASESTGINHNVNENLQLTGLTLNLIKNDSLIRFEEANNTSQNSFQLSNQFVELSQIGSQLSGLSNFSLTSHTSKFNSSPKYKTPSGEKNNLVYQESKHSSFGIPQSMYIRQRSSFFNRNTTTNQTTTGFKPFSSNTTENEEFRPEIHLPIHPNQNNTSTYECRDGKREKEKSIFNSQKQGTSHGKFMDCSEKWALSNSINRSKNGRYPNDDTSELINTEMDEVCSTCESEKQTAQHVGLVENFQSENRNISIEQFSCSSSKGSDISDKNKFKRYSLGRFWRVSHQVQTLVQGWLDTENEMDCKISERFADRERPLPKRSRLSVDSQEREKRIDIDPEMLLSNYSCEYDKSYMIERFKPE